MAERSVCEVVVSQGKGEVRARVLMTGGEEGGKDGRERRRDGIGWDSRRDRKGS